jgi:AraC-like DNA-binding protein
MTPSITVAGFNAIVQAAQRFGVSREMLLAALSSSHEDAALSGETLPVDTYFDAFCCAAALTDCDDLGLYVGRINYVSGIPLQLYMSTICGNFRQYLNLVPSILKLRGDIGKVQIKREGDLIRLEWLPLQIQSGNSRFVSDDILTCSAAIVNSLCVDPIPVLKARFTYAEPTDLAGLQQTFGNDLAFDQAVSCLYFDAGSLQAPVIKLDNPLAHGIAESLQALFEASDNSDPFLQTTRDSLARALPSGEVHIDVIATELGVSRRTLQRRLAQRDTNFMQLLGEVRSTLAVRYLADNRLVITEIAFLLGYSDLAAFSTAFRGWYECSPTEHRSRNSLAPIRK